MFIESIHILLVLKFKKFYVKKNYCKFANKYVTFVIFITLSKNLAFYC